MSDQALKAKPLDFIAALDRKTLFAEQPEANLNAILTIKPNDDFIKSNANTTKVSVCLAFDCSLSMEGENFDAAVATAEMIVDTMSSRNSLSLVAFQTSSQIVFDNVILADADKDQLKEQMNALRHYVGGTTNMAAGIDNAIEVFAQSYDSDAKILILLSDGTPDSTSRARASAQAASEQGIQLFAVGMGPSYDANQLLDLVKYSNGAVYGDSEIDKIAEIFRSLIARVEDIFATNVKLTFFFEDSVNLGRIIKTSPERVVLNARVNKGVMELNVGNLEQEKTYEFLLSLALDEFEEGRFRLLSVRLDYAVSGQGTFRQEIELNAIFSEEKSDEEIEETDSDVEEALNRAAIVQLADEFFETQGRNDSEKALELISQLEKHCDDDPVLSERVDKIKYALENNHFLDEKTINDFRLAFASAPSLKKPDIELPQELDKFIEENYKPDEVDFAEDTSVSLEDTLKKTLGIKADVEEEFEPGVFYDLVLNHPGKDKIRLLRTIRDTTLLNVKDIAMMIKRRNSYIARDLRNKNIAETLKQRLEDLGAKVTLYEKRPEDEN